VHNDFLFLWILHTQFIASRILLATIHNLGNHPCPRCLVSLNECHMIGLKKDMQTRRDRPRKWGADEQVALDNARNLIYTENKQVNSVRVENLLSKNSFVPTVVNRIRFVYV
jgi:hypothetical protein